MGGEGRGGERRGLKRANQAATFGSCEAAFDPPHTSRTPSVLAILSAVCQCHIPHSLLVPLLLPCDGFLWLRPRLQWPPSARLHCSHSLPLTARLVGSLLPLTLRHGRGAQYEHRTPHPHHAVRSDVRADRSSRGVGPPVPHSHTDTAADSAGGHSAHSTTGHARRAVLNQRQHTNDTHTRT